MTNRFLNGDEGDRPRGEKGQGMKAFVLALALATLPAAAPVEIAVLMLTAALYEQRESVVDRPLSDNHLYSRLLAPYRAMEA